MKNSPLVSVIIPVWNGACFLETAICSVQAQNHEALEILVIDDGSTDETPHVASHWQKEIRYLAFPHRGLAQSRLAGIAAAQGEIFAFLDVDDVWAVSKLKIQLSMLADNPDVFIVNGYTQLQRLVNAEGPPMRFENWGEPVLAPSFGSALFRRRALEQMDMTMALEPDYDLDWFMRARELDIPLRIHSDIVQYYRRHNSNHSNDHTRGKQALLLMLKESLARRQDMGMDGVSLPPLNS